jgi:pyruvyl transferase EpsI
MLAPYTKSIRFTDTVLPRRVSPDGRESALEAKLDEFRKAKVVMTDRLHGMVFSAITATPCIAFPNSYHKMEGLYRWLRELPYIRFARGLSEVPAHLEELWAMNGTEYDPAPFRDLFAPLDRLLTPPS